MKQSKKTRKEKIELSNQGICWKCGGELIRDIKGRQTIYICYKCEAKKDERKLENKRKGDEKEWEN